MEFKIGDRVIYKYEYRSKIIINTYIIESTNTYVSTIRFDNRDSNDELLTNQNIAGNTNGGWSGILSGSTTVNNKFLELEIEYYRDLKLKEILNV